ncbi:MAG: SRPBCC domain-containing protein [Opitutaceae bacterium]|nr:SRPBCC domain-containing protein [Opitutaceae bacterium]
MKTALLIVGALVALVAIVALVLQIAGSRMPRDHRSVVTATLKASRGAVWAAITDYAAMPRWWPAVTAIRIEKLPDGTELTWNKDKHGQEIPFRTAESRANEKLVRVIAKDDLPFGGTWTFELADAPGGGTQLTLTEDGFIKPAIFRAIATWFMGLDATQKDFVTHLEKHLAAK